jgi:hypothetical protein
VGRKLKWRVGAAASAALAAAGVLMAVTMSAHATTATPMAAGVDQAGPAEVGNLLDYANSDFEGTIGSWASVSNARLTDDTSEAYLHHDSLLDVVPAAGTSTFELGQGSSAVQISVGAGDTYTVGAYFKIPAVSGQSLTFGLGFHNSSRTLIRWVSTGQLSLASTGQWQYVSGQITAPPGAASVISSPRVTYSGASTGEAINMDEASFVPYRAAQIIGAYAKTAADWIAADKASDIGPLQSVKEFIIKQRALPAKWESTGNVCYGIEQALGAKNSAEWPACVVSYNLLESEADLVKFFTGLPAAQMVIMNWKNEPEAPGAVFPPCGGHAADGPAYVCDFEQESDNIRQAAGDAPNVFVEMDASSYQYDSEPGSRHDRGGAAPDCPYIPPASYVDFYLADHYNEHATDASLPNEKSPEKTEWSTWLNCVASSGKPIGLAEYGLDCKTQNPPQKTLADEIGKDNDYLAAIPGAKQPTIMWEYWDWDTKPPGCQMTSMTVKDQWKSAETQNGGR